MERKFKYNIEQTKVMANRLVRNKIDAAVDKMEFDNEGIRYLIEEKKILFKKSFDSGYKVEDVFTSMIDMLDVAEKIEASGSYCRKVFSYINEDFFFKTEDEIRELSDRRRSTLLKFIVGSTSYNAFADSTPENRKIYKKFFEFFKDWVLRTYGDDYGVKVIVANFPLVPFEFLEDMISNECFNTLQQFHYVERLMSSFNMLTYDDEEFETFIKHCNSTQ